MNPEREYPGLAVRAAATGGSGRPGLDAAARARHNDVRQSCGERCHSIFERKLRGGGGGGGGGGGDDVPALGETASSSRRNAPRWAEWWSVAFELRKSDSGAPPPQGIDQPPLGPSVVNVTHVPGLLCYLCTNSFCTGGCLTAAAAGERRERRSLIRRRGTPLAADRQAVRAVSIAVLYSSVSGFSRTSRLSA